MRSSSGNGVFFKCPASTSLIHPAEAKGAVTGNAHTKKVDSYLQGMQQQIDMVLQRVSRRSLVLFFFFFKIN